MGKTENTVEFGVFEHPGFSAAEVAWAADEISKAVSIKVDDAAAMDDDDSDAWKYGKRGYLAGVLTIGPLVLILWWLFG